MPQEQTSPKKTSRLAAALVGFWHDVKHSAYDLGWYRHLRREPDRRGFGYLASFVGVFAVAYTLSALVFAMALPSAAARHLEKTVPEETYVELKGGRFTSSFPEGWEAGDKDFRFAVAATLAGLTPPERPENSWVVIGEDAVFVKDGQGSLRVQPLKDLPDFRWERGGVVGFLRSPVSYVLLVAFVLAFGAMTYGFLLAWNAALVYLYSLLATVASRIAGAPVAYDRWVKMGWRLVTTPMLAVAVLRLTGARVPLAFFVVYFMFVVAIIADEKKAPVGKAAADSQ